jgi:hypothetical protein
MAPQHEFQFQARLRLLDYGQHVIDVGAEIVAHVNGLGSKRVIAELALDGRHLKIHGSLHPQADGQGCVQVGGKGMKQLKAASGDIVEVRLRNDDTLYQCEFPEAMAEVLATDPEAKAAFDRLRPGTVRGFLFWVMDVKSADKQVERALAVAEGLKHGVTTPQELVGLRSRR